MLGKKPNARTNAGRNAWRARYIGTERQLEWTRPKVEKLARDIISIEADIEANRRMLNNKSDWMTRKEAQDEIIGLERKLNQLRTEAGHKFGYDSSKLKEVLDELRAARKVAEKIKKKKIKGPYAERRTAKPEHKVAKPAVKLPEKIAAISVYGSEGMKTLEETVRKLITLKEEAGDVKKHPNPVGERISLDKIISALPQQMILREFDYLENKISTELDGISYLRGHGAEEQRAGLNRQADELKRLQASYSLILARARQG